MIRPLDVIIQHSKEKNKRQLRFFFSQKNPWKVTYAVVLQEHFILSKPDTSSTTQKLEL